MRAAYAAQAVTAVRCWPHSAETEGRARLEPEYCVEKLNFRAELTGELTSDGTDVALWGDVLWVLTPRRAV